MSTKLSSAEDAGQIVREGSPDTEEALSGLGRRSGAGLGRPPSGVRRLFALARANILATVLAVTTAASLAGAVGFGVAWSSEHALVQQEAQVRAVSSGFLTALTNFDPGTIDADFSRITGYATGAFLQQAHQFFGTKIRQQLETARAGSRGEVRHLFIESMSAGSATVYAVVDQTYANAKMSTPNADVLRVVLQMAKAPGSGAWKVANVTVLQPPSVYSGSQPTAAPNPASSPASPASPLG